MRGNSLVGSEGSKAPSREKSNRRNVGAARGQPCDVRVSARRRVKKLGEQRDLPGHLGSCGVFVHRQTVDASAPAEVPPTDGRRVQSRLAGPFRTGQHRTRTSATTASACVAARRGGAAQGNPQGGPPQAGETGPREARGGQETHSGAQSRPAVLDQPSPRVFAATRLMDDDP